MRNIKEEISPSKRMSNSIKKISQIFGFQKDEINEIKNENEKFINENNNENNNYNYRNVVKRESYELSTTDKLMIGKKFGLTTDIISTLTTASLRGDLIGLQFRLLDISPPELRNRIEPMFDLDPILQSSQSRQKKTLERRLSFTRPSSSSFSEILTLPQSPQTQSIDSTLSSLPPRSISLDRDSNQTTLVKELFPSKLSTSSSNINTSLTPYPSQQQTLSQINPPIPPSSQPIRTKQEERQLQRKELALKTESIFKNDSNNITRSFQSRTNTTNTTNKNEVQHRSSVNLQYETPNKNHSKVESKLEKQNTPNSTRQIRSSSISAPKQSNSLQEAAQKAVAIFTSRISSKKPTQSNISSNSSVSSRDSQSSKGKSTSESRDSMRSISTTTPKTPLKSSTSTNTIKPRTPGSSTIHLQRSNSTSSLSNVTTSSSQLKNIPDISSILSSTPASTISSTSSVSTTHSSVSSRSTTIKPSSNHVYKPKSVTASNSSSDQTKKQPINPPTLRGGGGAAKLALQQEKNLTANPKIVKKKKSDSDIILNSNNNDEKLVESVVPIQSNNSPLAPATNPFDALLITPPKK